MIFTELAPTTKNQSEKRASVLMRFLPAAACDFVFFRHGAGVDANHRPAQVTTNAHPIFHAIHTAPGMNILV